MPGREGQYQGGQILTRALVTAAMRLERAT